MIESVAISGTEAVWVLLQRGFLARRGIRVTVLERGRHVVAVPDVPLLAPELFAVILRESGLSFSEFVAALDKRRLPAANESGVRVRYQMPDERSHKRG